MPKGTPDGFHTLSPYLFIRGADRAIEWYKQAFGAEEVLRTKMPDGSIMHAEIKIGDSHIMLGDDPEPQSPLPNRHLTHFHRYVDDVDAFIDRAVAAGAKLGQPPKDTQDGERRGGIDDPFGFVWWVATVTKPMSRAEMQRMYDAKSTSD
jgi:PhnB protein